MLLSQKDNQIPPVNVENYNGKCKSEKNDFCMITYCLYRIIKGSSSILQYKANPILYFSGYVYLLIGKMRDLFTKAQPLVKKEVLIELKITYLS